MVQDGFVKQNATYKITRDISLEGSTLYIPSGCTLDFQGGSISNGTVVMNGTAMLNISGGIEKYITATITGTYREGQTLYDSNLKKMKLWNGTSWVNLDGTPLDD